MTDRTDTTGISRRTALKLSVGALVSGGGGAATGGTAAATRQDEEEELPPQIADAVGMEPGTDIQQAQAVTARSQGGWRVGILYTSDDRRLVRGGDSLRAECRIENDNPRRETATVWFVVGRDPDVVDSRTVTVPGLSSVRTTVGYETYPVRRIDRFPVWVLVDGPGWNDWDMTEVVVYPVG